MAKSKFQWNRLWLLLAMVVLTLYNHHIYKMLVLRYYETMWYGFQYVEYLFILATMIMGVGVIIPLVKNLKKGVKCLAIIATILLIGILGDVLLEDSQYDVTSFDAPIAEVHLDGAHSYFITYLGDYEIDDDGQVHFFDSSNTEDIGNEDSHKLKISCEEDYARHIITNDDVHYRFECCYFTHDPQNAVLRTIDLFNYCDNRGK